MKLHTFDNPIIKEHTAEFKTANPENVSGAFYTFKGRYDGCIDITKLEHSAVEAQYLHICDLNNFINHLITLRKKLEQIFPDEYKHE